MTHMTNLQQRKVEIITKIAAKAYQQPLLNSGFLFQQDVRDNFYYASYLFAASQDQTIPFEGDREQAKSKAEGVLLLLLELQDQQPESATYGHWPLNLFPSPEEASKNTLPVELMGSLMVIFYQRYAHEMSVSLRSSFDRTFHHIYQSNFYRKPMTAYNHHEAKYTAAKLIFGQLYEDKALLEDGFQSLRSTLERIQTVGMVEYSALPWFWHWVQAFTCAWELIKDEAIQTTLAEMLDYLWNVRATYYLGGAWAGAHSRIWPHDMPKDTNVLHDYVQFGDFSLPDHMPRTEYAGFLAYEASEAIKAKALNRFVPTEVKRQVPKQVGQGLHDHDVLHSYLYLTESFAVGGMYERIAEFDNEQHRWDVCLPLCATPGVNHAYFFHPGNKFSEGDLRHQSEYVEVLFHRNVIMASYQIPEDQSDQIIGCLPVGEWVEETNGLFGLCGQVYMAVYMDQPFQREVQLDRSVVTSKGNKNAVVIECMDKLAAQAKGIINLQQFVSCMNTKQPDYQTSKEAFNLTYTNLSEEILVLSCGPDREITRLVNDQPVDLTTYTVA
ncbi:hypothetical protein HQN90_03080 [Paenibacillus alba]|nr:hypothetical protein [Paenibacillus alba]